MSISYKLQKNHLTNGANQYWAAVEYTKTIDLEGVIDLMVFRGSSINKADMLAVFEDFFDTIAREVLDGKRVVTPGGNYGVSIKGNFTDEDDIFDPSRHELIASVTPGVRIRRAVETRAQLEKQEAIEPRPNPRLYTNLNNGDGNDTLTPGSMGRLSGYRLKFDPTEAAQGIFLLPVDANGQPDAGRSTVRIEVVGRNKGRELLFMVPAGLATGAYVAEVRARFGSADPRVGRLSQTLTVA